jgi:Rha family phage regulatory protein
MIITKLCHKYKYVQAICLALLIPLMLLEDVLTAIWEDCVNSAISLSPTSSVCSDHRKSHRESQRKISFITTMQECSPVRVTMRDCSRAGYGPLTLFTPSTSNHNKENSTMKQIAIPVVTSKGYTQIEVAFNADGIPVVTSLNVAEVFGKMHHHVMRDIDALDCSRELRESKFVLASYKPERAKRSYPMYEMTRDGFTFLAMGFTGERAAQFKEGYIKAFNQMEAELTSGTAWLSSPTSQTPSKPPVLGLTSMNSVWRWNPCQRSHLRELRTRHRERDHAPQGHPL